MLNFAYNLTPKRNIDGSDVSGMSISFSYKRKPAQWRPFWMSRSSDFMPRIFTKQVLDCRNTWYVEYKLKDKLRLPQHLYGLIWLI